MRRLGHERGHRPSIVLRMFLFALEPGDNPIETLWKASDDDCQLDTSGVSAGSRA